MQRIKQVIPWTMAAGRALLGPVILFGDHCGWSGMTLAGMVVTALLSDIFDGVLARRWHVDTAAVRLFDSMCDMAFYACVAVALWPQIWTANPALTLTLLLLEAINFAVAFAKFGRPASYHSYLAKAWGLVLASALIAVFADGHAGLPMRTAIVMGILSNLETMTMSLMLPIWHRDVKTLREAWRIRLQMYGRPARDRQERGNSTSRPAIHRAAWMIGAAFLFLSLTIPSIAHAQTEKLASEQASQTLAQETQARGYWVDTSTGLMWAAKDNGAKELNWHQAMKYCRNLRLAGYPDWRLASVDELKAIYDRNAEARGLNPKSRWHDDEPMNFHVKGGLYLDGNQWTSTRKSDDRGKPSGYAWRFDFLDGRPFGGDQLWFNTDKHALCVRGTGK